MDLLAILMPILVGAVWIAVFSLFREPFRQRISALMVGGAGAAYISSGAFDGALGFLELGFTALIVAVAYLGLSDYRWIGVGWLLHTAWDVVHHLEGAPIIPHLPGSSFGCAISDPVIAVWYLMGAPSIWGRDRAHRDTRELA